MNGKEQVTATILRAQSELAQALGQLAKMPAIDPGEIAFSAHALNNYLMVNGSTAELLLLSLADHPDPEVHKWLEGLTHVTKLMRHTVSHLMTSSEPSDTELKLSEWDLVQLARRACNYYQRIADRKNISIVFESAADISTVWTDPAVAAAILDNLLSNAVKYSFAGKQIKVQMLGGLDWVVCSVCDEGPGLSQADQAKLFQRGVRLSPEPTGGEPSSGYGLAVAKELIDRLGGMIDCESTLGAGACFSFRLPVYQENR